MPSETRSNRALTARIHVITLGVDDLDRALNFYREGLGLPSDGITGTQFVGDETNPSGAIAMFHLADGLILSLYPRSELAKDAAVSPDRTLGSGVSLGHLVNSRAEVDGVLELVQTAGGTVLGPAHDRPWGIYSGYFEDPDGHLWEVIYFPGQELPTGGSD